MSVLIPDLVNVYTPDGDTFAWLKMLYDGEDLEFEAAHKHEIGAMDEGVAEELQQCGWEGILAREGWSFRVRGLSFALEHGVAPGQPFLVWVQKPRYYSSWTDCGTEYDVEINWDFLRVKRLCLLFRFGLGSD